MEASSGWDPGLPPTAFNGGPTVPEWMGGVGIGQLQILSLYATNGETKLCPFIVGKSMQDLVGEIENTTTEANGMKYVLRVRDAGQVRKLLSMKKLFNGTAVTVELHPVFNKRRCLISCREIQNKTEQELMEWLAKDGVVGVKRITRMQDGKPVNTPTVILTLNGTAVPEHIKVGPLRIKTRMYIPDPMICYKCFNYGHSKLRCKGAAKCRNCSKTHDLEGECNAAPFCQHCQGAHGPANRSCPVYAMEKEIVRLRFTKGISQEEAKKQIQSGGGSYAAVSSAVQQRLVNARTSTGQSDQLKAKDDLIKQLTETITKLTNRIDELEKKCTSKKEKKRSRKIQILRDEGSGSKMETDSSAKQSAPGQPSVGISSQVSAVLPKPSVQKYKCHPTTEIHAPIVKKASADQSQQSSDLAYPPLNSKSPPNHPGILDQLQTLMDSTRLNSPHSQSHNGQHTKPHK